MRKRICLLISSNFQNNLNVGVWVTIEFGGSIPLLITGEITSVEEDMIEISQVDEDDKLYIDFGYKGLPPDLRVLTGLNSSEKPGGNILLW